MPSSCPPLNRVCDQRLAGQWRRSGWGRVCAEGLQARWSQSAAQEQSLAPPPWGSCDGRWTTTPSPPIPHAQKIQGWGLSRGVQPIERPTTPPWTTSPGPPLVRPPPPGLCLLGARPSLSPGEGTPTLLSRTGVGVGELEGAWS